MSYNPNNANGQATMANSAPVVIASNQSSVAVTEASASSALTALQLIDDTVFTDDTSTHATGTTKGQGMMAVANPTDAAVDANDIGMLAMTLARALKNDITTIAGTAPTTAGFIDIKGADGNVFVRQATAGNLNMTEASAANALTALQLIDDTVIADNVGFTDGTTKVTMAGFIYDEVAGTAVSENDAVAARVDIKRAVVNVLEDATTRGLRAGVVDETGSSAVDALATGGGTPHDSVDSGNPVKQGFKAITALPTAVAASDRANGISDVFGRQLVAHIDAGQQIWKSYNDTASRAAGSAQILWTPAGGKKIAITSVTISAYGTTAARMFLFFAANADLTYSAGTDQPVFVGSFAPSTTSKPMVVITPAVPMIANTADFKLLYQNDAALSVDIVVHGYEL